MNKSSSTHTKQLLRCRASVVALLTPLLITGAWAQDAPTAGEPEQLPLVSARTMASPNIMLLFDDSGSMTANAVPDDLESLATRGYFYRSTLHPNDFSGTGGEMVYNTNRVISANPNDRLSAMYRSYEVNKNYYNPASTYEPWSDADGNPYYAAWRTFNNGPVTKREDIDPRRVPIYAGRFTGRFVDLTGVNLRFNFLWGDRRELCYWPTAAGSPQCAHTGPNLQTFTPAIYFIYNGPNAKDPDFGYTSADAGIRNLANYTPVIIENIGSGGILQAGTRRDCTSLSSQPGDPANTKRCSREEEYRNFAIWYAYYRGRTRAAIGALTQVFAKDYGLQFRLGWGNLTASNRNIDSTGNYTYIKQGVRAFDDAFRNTFYSWLFNIEDGTTANSTPTRAALNEAGRYYSSRGNSGPWGAAPGTNNTSAHLACRRSYTIMITDGGFNENFSAIGNADNRSWPTITGPNSQSYTYSPTAPYRDTEASNMADVAFNYWVQDLRPDLENAVVATGENPAFWQHMVTHTVGFGVRGTLAETDIPNVLNGSRNWPGSGTSAADPRRIDDLRHTAINGHGTYSSASNVDALIQSLGSILENLAAGNIQASYTVSQTNYLETSNRAYVPSYMTAMWTGDLISYRLGSAGKLGAIDWKASDNLPSAADRNIWIKTQPTGAGAGSHVYEFKWSSLPSDLTNPETGTLKTANLVDFLRGDNTFADGSTFRYRPSNVLGDIVNSTPVYIPATPQNRAYATLPAGTPGRTVYNLYRDAVSDRQPMVFVGANDGMLHAFATEGTDKGKEAFAFIPSAVISKLPDLASPLYDKNHRYFMDGPITVTDIFRTTCGSESPSCWRNVLIASAGAGARSISALDITHTDNYAATNGNKPSATHIANTIMWELTPASPGMSELGFVMQPIQTGYIKTGDGMADGKWVGIFGNGPYSASGQAVLYIIDLETGAVLRSIPVGNTNHNGLMGVTLIRNRQNVITGVYAGDLKGNIWRFDLGTSNPDTWASAYKQGASTTPAPLFSTQGHRPVTQAPVYAAHPHGGRMVLFGTGKFYDNSDLTDMGTEALYGIWDNGSTVNYGSILRRSATPVTINGKTYYRVDSGNIDWSRHKGWTLPLNMENGQRSLFSPRLLGSNVEFATSLTEMDNSLTESCSVEGLRGINIIVNLYSGGIPSIQMDTNADGIIDASDGYYIGYHTDTAGPGISLTHPGMTSGGPLGNISCTEGRIYITDTDGSEKCVTPRVDSSFNQLF